MLWEKQEDKMNQEKFGGGPFVPVPKKWLLAYQPEERKRMSVSDLVGKLYELDQ